MLTQHNRKTARLSPDYTLAIRELGVWSGDETRPSSLLFYFWVRGRGRPGDEASLKPLVLVWSSLALPTLYPKSRVVGSGLIRYMELCTVTRNLFIQSECVFSS